MRRSSPNHPETRSPETATGARHVPILLAVCLALVCGGPAGAGLTGYSEAPRIETAARPALQTRLEPGQAVEPFALDAEMRRWAHETVSRRLNAEQKLQRLLQGLVEREGLDLEYSWGYTGTAREVFQEHRANCLAFTNLFLGLAREVGVPAYFLAVETETFRKRGDFVVISDHIAVGYGGGQEIRMYDFSSHRNQQELPRVRRISDTTAVAMFHSNRGVEVLQTGRVDDAITWLRVAVELDPELATAWVNLGVAQRRAGDFDAAERSYRHALEVDPRTYAAYQNLSALLRLTERTSEAEDLERALRRSPNRNPFSYLTLGDISLRNGRFDEARRLYKRALALHRDHPEPYAALGQLAVVSGDLDAARKMLRKARKRDVDHRRTVQLSKMIGSH